MELVLVCGLCFLLSQEQVSVVPPQNEKDTAVIYAILHSVVTPEKAKMDRADHANAASSQVAMLSKTLAVCEPESHVRCITDAVIASARKRSASGDFDQQFAARLGELTVAQAVDSITFPDLAMTTAAAAELNRVPYSLAVSAPIYVREQSLVYVQFGHGYNNVSWLVLLSKVGPEWRVQRVFLVSMGN